MGGYGGLMGAFTESFSADTYMRYKIKQERDGATDNDNPPRGSLHNHWERWYGGEIRHEPPLHRPSGFRLSPE